MKKVNNEEPTVNQNVSWIFAGSIVVVASMLMVAPHMHTHTHTATDNIVIHMNKWQSKTIYRFHFPRRIAFISSSIEAILHNQNDRTAWYEDNIHTNAG